MDEVALCRQMVHEAGRIGDARLCGHGKIYAEKFRRFQIQIHRQTAIRSSFSRMPLV
jgi:hypothetical protein